MPISARWRKLGTLPAPRGRDALPGIYELADADKRILYIGQSAKDVPNRIRQHLRNTGRSNTGRSTGCIAEVAVYWRYAYSRVPQADEAAHIERYEAKHGALPPCNQAKPRTRGAERRYRERSRDG